MIKLEKGVKAEREIGFTNIYNLKEMRDLKYRNPLTPRDPSVWEKTAIEKELVKKTKRMFKNYQFSSSWIGHPRPVPCYGYLIIQLSKQAGQYISVYKANLTRKIWCGQSDIPECLSRYTAQEVNKKGEYVATHSLIRKYKWNDRWYNIKDQYPNTTVIK